MSFGRTGKLDHIDICGERIECSENTKFLGVWIDENLNWNKHINTLVNKLKRNLSLLQNTRNLFNQSTLKLIYHAYLQSHINYGIVVWGGMLNNKALNRLQQIQTKCLKYIDVSIKQPHQLKLLSIAQLIKFEHAKLGYRLHNNLLPRKIKQLISTDSNDKSLAKKHNYNTRNKNKLNIPKINNKMYRDSFLYQTNKEFLLLPKIIASKPNIQCIHQISKTNFAGCNERINIT